MHEKILWDLLDSALRNEEPVMTPIERKHYLDFVRTAKEFPGCVIDIPTSLPDYGIEMRYAGANGDGVTLEEAEDLSRKAQFIISRLEKHGMRCEDGLLTIAFDDKMEKKMEMKTVNGSTRLILPRFGCAVKGQVEEQLAYGLSAYTLRNFNPDETYALRTLEGIACRTVSVHMLRVMRLNEKVEEVLSRGGTRFICDTKMNGWERAGDTAEDIRRLSTLFCWEDLVPFLRLRDYVSPSESAENRRLNTKALRHNYEKSKAVQALCDIWVRIESDTDDFVDYMMGDPYENDP